MTLLTRGRLGLVAALLLASLGGGCTHDYHSLGNSDGGGSGGIVSGAGGKSGAGGRGGSGGAAGGAAGASGLAGRGGAGGSAAGAGGSAVGAGGGAAGASGLAGRGGAAGSASGGAGGGTAGSAGGGGRGGAGGSASGGGAGGSGGTSGIAGHGGAGGAAGSGGAGGASTTCTGWGAPADMCEMETDGFSRACDCPGFQGCIYYRFGDSTCSTCSPWSCGEFLTNGSTYGPIGTDPRPASCRCASCKGDLSNVGTGNFNIQFTLTTSTKSAAVLNQRAVCYTDEMWDVRTTGSGTLEVETDDNSGTYTELETPVVVTDGSPHAIVITRLKGTLMVMVDGNEVVSGLSTANLTALHALASGTDICVTTGGSNGTGDGTVNLVGTVTDVCIL